MSITRRFVVGVAWMFAGNWLEVAANFAVFVALAHILSPHAFGVAMMSMAFIVFGESLVRETTSELLIRRTELDARIIDAVFWISASISVALALLLVGTAKIIALHLYHESQVAQLMRWGTLSIIILGLSGVPVTLMRRDLEFRVLAVRATVGVLLGGIVGIAVALNGGGAWAIVIQRIVQIFVTDLLAWVARPWVPGFRAGREEFREGWMFGSKMVGLRATELVSIQTPVVVTGSVLGAAALGYYSIAWRTVDVISNVLTAPIRYVAQPAFAKLQVQPDQAGDLLTDLTQTSSVIGFSAFFGLAAIASPALPLIFGAHWQPAVPVVAILCTIGMFFAVERIQQAFCLAMGVPGKLFLTAVAEAAVGVPLILIAAPHGLSAVAAAAATRYLCVWPLRLYIVRSVAAMSTLRYLASIGTPLLIALLMYVGVVLWKHLSSPWMTEWILLISSAMIGAILYAVGIWLFLPSKLRQLMHLIKNWRSTSNQGS